METISCRLYQIPAERVTDGFLEMMNEDYHNGDCVILSPEEPMTSLMASDVRYAVIEFPDKYVVVLKSDVDDDMTRALLVSGVN